MRTLEMVLHARSHLVFHVVMVLVVINSNLTSAASGYCFRQRTPIGMRGKCRDKIVNMPGPSVDTPVSSAEECCLAGGTGWAEKSTGKRCVDSCQQQQATNNADSMDQTAGVNREDSMSEEEIAQAIFDFGVWLEWGEWLPCSVSCGVGHVQRMRNCSSSETGREIVCEGNDVENLPCDTNTPCQVHGQWGEWSEWSECSATCGESMIRYRDCDSPAPGHGGDDCAGISSEVSWCNNRRNCPINGGWKAWGDWSTCSVTCGRRGNKHRYRSCTNPKPGYNGMDCEGVATMQRPCSTNTICPIDGGWSEWYDWRCPEECDGGGEGWAWRIRSCSKPIPRHSGRQCVGKGTENARCSKSICAVDGGWSEWSDWGDCLPACGYNSFRVRSRTCDNPRPSQGGFPCMGDEQEPQTCESEPCNSTIEYGDSSSAENPLCDDEDYMSQEGGSGCGSGAGSESSPESISYNATPDYE